VAAVACVTIQRVEEMREREKWEQERAGPGILAYVHQADTSADEHNGLAYVAAVAPSSATR
jgi:hypothetical protein